MPARLSRKLVLAGEDPLCVATLELFSSIYGAEGRKTWPLKCLATGGGVCRGEASLPKMLATLRKWQLSCVPSRTRGALFELLKSVAVKSRLESPALRCSVLLIWRRGFDSALTSLAPPGERSKKVPSSVRAAQG